MEIRMVFPMDVLKGINYLSFPCSEGIPSGKTGI